MNVLLQKKMRSKKERELVLKLKIEENSFKNISRKINLSKNVIINMYYYDHQFVKKKREPKFKLCSF